MANLEAAEISAFTYWEVPEMEHGWNALPVGRRTALIEGMLDWLMTGSVAPAKQDAALTP